MATSPIPCPICQTSSDFVNVTPEPDEREYYFDIHWCPMCPGYFTDDAHPLIYDYDEELFIEVETPAMTRAQLEAAGQLRLF